MVCVVAVAGTVPEAVNPLVVQEAVKLAVGRTPLQIVVAVPPAGVSVNCTVPVRVAFPGGAGRVAVNITDWLTLEVGNGGEPLGGFELDCTEMVPFAVFTTCEGVTVALLSLKFGSLL
jgi:hypothetical protein